MPSRKIRSRKKRSRVVKKQTGKSKKKSVKKPLTKLKVKLPDLFSKVSLKPPLLKPKKGKSYQVTSSSIKRKQKVNNILNEFIFSLNEPFTRKSFMDSVAVFRKNVVSSSSKVAPPLRRNVIAALKSIEYTLSNLQESRLQEWLKEYQSDDQNKTRDISLVVKSLAQESLKDDTDRVLSMALELSTDLEEFSTLSKPDKDKILEIVSNRIKELGIEIANPGNKKYLEFLEKNPDKAVDIIIWMAENFVDKSDVWDRIADLMPLEDEDEDVIVIKQSKRSLKSPRTTKMVISLSTMIGEIQRMERMVQQGVVEKSALKKLEEKARRSLGFIGGLNLSTVRALIELNTSTNNELFKDIDLLKRLTFSSTGHDLSSDKNSEEVVELREKIISLLESNGIDPKIVIDGNPVISISVIPGDPGDGYGRYNEDTPDIYTAIGVSEEDIKKEDVPTVGDWGSDVRKHKLIEFAKTPKTARDIEKIQLNDAQSKVLVTKIMTVIKGYVDTVLDEFLNLDSLRNDTQVQIFSKWYKNVFVDNLFSHIEDDSQTMNDVLNKVSEFLIFFIIDKYTGAKKNKFIITNLTGSLNQRESGEYFRSEILQRRITPQSILEKTIRDKLPIIFSVANLQESLILNRVRQGVRWLKDNLVQIILNSIDPTSKNIRRTSIPSDDIPESIIDPSDNKLKTKQEFLKSYGPTFKSQREALKIWNKTKKVVFEDLILHSSCDDSDRAGRHTVLYLEDEEVNGKKVKMLYCFDLQQLYELLTESSGVFLNPYSGVEFSEEFRESIQNITPETMKDIKEKNAYLLTLTKKSDNTKAIQRWFRRTRNKKDLKFKNKGAWAIKLLLKLQPVKDYIEEHKPIESGVDEDDDEELDILDSDSEDDDEELDILDSDDDLFGSDDEDDDEDEEDKPRGTGAASPVESQDEASSDTSFSMNDKCNMCNKPCTFGFASIKDGPGGFQSFQFCGQEACLAGFSFNK